MSRRTVVLHVGHGKTGSSFIQSSLAMSVPSLADVGISYPSHCSLADAAMGRISSGNGDYKVLTRRVEAEFARDYRVERILFSHEGFFGDILADSGPVEELLAANIDVEILLFVRDPLDHAISAYMQLVKRGGYSQDFSQYVSSANVVTFVENFIRKVKGLGCSLKIVNYSRHKADVLGKFAEMLGVQRSVLSSPKVSKVNRSLTRAEMYLQRVINGVHDGIERCIVADAFCNDLPDIESEYPEFTKEDADRFLDRMKGPVNSCNRFLPEEARYPLDELALFDFSKTDAQDGDLTFTKEQVATIGHLLGQHMSRLALRQPVDAFPVSSPNLRRGNQAAALFSVAIKIERGEVLSVDDERAILTAALMLKPYGKMIRLKLDSLSPTWPVHKQHEPG